MKTKVAGVLLVSCIAAGYYAWQRPAHSVPGDLRDAVAGSGAMETLSGIAVPGETDIPVPSMATADVPTLLQLQPGAQLVLSAKISKQIIKETAGVVYVNGVAVDSLASSIWASKRPGPDLLGQVRVNTAASWFGECTMIEAKENVLKVSGVSVTSGENGGLELVVDLGNAGCVKGVTLKRIDGIVSSVPELQRATVEDLEATFGGNVLIKDGI